MNIQTKRIEDCFNWLQKEFEQTGEVQSVDLLIQKLDSLCNVLPFVKEQMAIAKRVWNEAKLSAYHKLKTSSESQKEYYAPSLAKDYVNAQCSNEQYAFDLAERCSRSIVHIIDAVRTSISALKEERITSRYGQSVMQNN